MGRRSDEFSLRSEFSGASKGRRQRFLNDPLYLLTESSSDLEHLLMISFRDIGLPRGDSEVVKGTERLRDKSLRDP